MLSHFLLEYNVFDFSHKVWTTRSMIRSSLYQGVTLPSFYIAFYGRDSFEFINKPVRCV